MRPVHDVMLELEILSTIMGSVSLVDNAFNGVQVIQRLRCFEQEHRQDLQAMKAPLVTLKRLLEERAQDREFLHQNYEILYSLFDVLENAAITLKLDESNGINQLKEQLHDSTSDLTVAFIQSLCEAIDIRVESVHNVYLLDKILWNWNEKQEFRNMITTVTSLVRELCPATQVRDMQQGHQNPQDEFQIHQDDTKGVNAAMFAAVRAIPNQHTSERFIHSFKRNSIDGRYCSVGVTESHSASFIDNHVRGDYNNIGRLVHQISDVSFIERPRLSCVVGLGG